MIKALLIFLLFFLSCEGPQDVELNTEKSRVMTVDLAQLIPEKVDISVFDKPGITDGLVFRTSHTSYLGSRRFQMKNTPSQKGLFIWHDSEWKPHGEWFFFEDGILAQRTFFKRGVLSYSTGYDRFGAIVAAGDDNYDRDLNRTRICPPKRRRGIRRRSCGLRGREHSYYDTLNRLMTGQEL